MKLNLLAHLGRPLRFVTIALAGLFAAPVLAGPEVVIYKSPTCGCCTNWADHMEENGFEIITNEVNDLSRVKQLYGVNPNLASCHTAIVDGYVVEGHVPADDVKRLLAERPKDVTGITVPGMPIGSPGMEQGDTKQPYDVLTFGKNGVRVYNRYRE